MHVPPALFLFIRAHRRSDPLRRSLSVAGEDRHNSHSRYGGEHVSLEDVELVIASFHRG